MTDLVLPSRRSFITGLTSLVAAPAIVRVSSLTVVKPVHYLTGYEIMVRCREDRMFDVLYGRLFVSPAWLNLAAQELIRIIPEIYDTRNDDA